MLQLRGSCELRDCNQHACRSRSSSQAYLSGFRMNKTYPIGVYLACWCASFSSNPRDWEVKAKNCRDVTHWSPLVAYLIKQWMFVLKGKSVYCIFLRDWTGLWPEIIYIYYDKDIMLLLTTSVEIKKKANRLRVCFCVSGSPEWPRKQQMEWRKTQSDFTRGDRKPWPNSLISVLMVQAINGTPPVAVTVTHMIDATRPSVSRTQPSAAFSQE